MSNFPVSRLKVLGVVLGGAGIIACGGAGDTPNSESTEQPTSERIVPSPASAPVPSTLQEESEAIAPSLVPSPAQEPVSAIGGEQIAEASAPDVTDAEPLVITEHEGWATVQTVSIQETSEDRSCSFELEYFQIEYPDDPVLEEIVNTHLKTIAFSSETPYLQPFYIESCAEKVSTDQEKAEAENSGYHYELHPVLYFNKDGFLSVAYHYSEYSLDGSKNTTIRTVNFDLLSGQKYEYNDLFLTESTINTEIKTLIFDQLKNIYQPEIISQSQLNPVTDFMFYITEKGLIFTNLVAKNGWNLTRVEVQPEDVVNALKPTRLSEVLLVQGEGPDPHELPTCVLTDADTPEGDIAETGVLTFDISNPVGNPPQDFALVEVLMLGTDGSPLQFDNPFRVLQGMSLTLDPPLKAGETREVEWFRKYLTDWASVEIKACQWLAADDYWKRYPELRNYSTP